MQTYFKDFDKRNSGALNTVELQDAFSRCTGHNVSEADVKKLVSYTFSDKNVDGQLSYDEFWEMMQKLGALKGPE